jgi:hypothetical protein
MLLLLVIPVPAGNLLPIWWFTVLRFRSLGATLYTLVGSYLVIVIGSSILVHIGGLGTAGEKEGKQDNY